MIEINDLSIAIGKRQIVNIPNLVFEKGKVSGIIGLNGSGKTTLLNSLSSYVKPTTGNILFEGELLTRTSVGFLETNNFFYSTITGREYLQIFDSPNDRFDVEKWKDILGLPIDSLISSYSTGMKKKLAFMGVLKLERPVLILDEPFNGMDSESVQTFLIVLKNLKAEGKIIIVSSHMIEILIGVCDEIHLLNNAKIEKTYKPDRYNFIKDEVFGSLQENINAQMIAHD